jgi:hypothetical protein
MLLPISGSIINLSVFFAFPCSFLFHQENVAISNARELSILVCIEVLLGQCLSKKMNQGGPQPYHTTISGFVHEDFFSSPVLKAPKTWLIFSRLARVQPQVYRARIMLPEMLTLFSPMSRVPITVELENMLGRCQLEFHGMEYEDHDVCIQSTSRHQQ